MEIPFYRHDIQETDICRLADAARENFLTTGEITTEFETKFANLFGAKNAIGTTNWTSAAELVLRLWGVGHGDEVIVPTMSYIASAHAVAMRGATPVFVDSDPETGILDIACIEENISPRTKVIMPVHLYGVMVDMERLRAVANRHGIKILEDAAHAVVSERGGIKPGQRGDAAAFSFYATKNIASGEGGALVTNDDELAERFRRGTCCGVTKTAFARRREGDTGYVGYDSSMISGKCNMTNLSAALLVGQVERVLENRKRRGELVHQYRKQLASIPGIQLPKIPDGAESSHYVMVILCQAGTRSQILEILKRNQIGCAINFEPIHLKMVYREQYGHKSGEFPVAEDWGSRCVTLPLYNQLSKDQISFIAETLRKNYKP